MLSDQRGNARPRRKREESFHKAGPDERTRPEALAPSAVRCQRVNQRGYFGRVEEFRNVANSRATRYLARCHRRSLSCGRAPGSANFAGAYFLGFAGLILVLASDGTPLLGAVDGG
jgi:hypothetical protein